jgi:hypothetical protein
MDFYQTRSNGKKLSEAVAVPSGQSLLKVPPFGWMIFPAN